MLSPKQSIENFKQKVKIEKALGERYGYHSQSNRYELPKVRQKQRKQRVSINSSITPLIVKQKQIQQSERLRQLNKEIEQLQIQKKVNKMANKQQSETNANVQVKVDDLINAKIKEYNYLVDHKHLIKRKPAKSLFINVSQNYVNDPYIEQSQNMLEQIRKKQKQLNQTGNLMHKYKRNQHITSLYKGYSMSMKLEQKTKFQPMTSPINRKIAATEMRIAVKLKQNQKVKQPSIRYKEQAKIIDIDDTYADKKFMSSSKQINQGVRRNKKISLLIREKLQAIKLKRQSELEEKSQIIKNNETLLQQMKTNVTDFSLEYLQLSSKISFKQQEQELKQQKSYLSLALQKRSPRYIKQEGSKFVSKFDPDLAAELMIQGPKRDDEKNKKKVIQLKSNIKKVKIPADLSPEDKMVMGFMVEEESDAYYWTTCRNQKVNLMLKGRKHS